MAISSSRAQFLRGSFKASPVLRPPWAITESEFINHCSRCNDCITSCPSQIIKRGSGGFPEIDFQQGECTLCGDCLTACPTGALNPSISPPRPYHIQITSQCLSYQGVFCMSCQEQCETRAIRFPMVNASVPQPIIEHDQCTGCGACVAPCPTAAISLHPINMEIP